jgi:hypothetical protein
MSIHPTTTSDEIQLVCESIKALAANHKEWSIDYTYNPKTNEFTHKNALHSEKKMVDSWFK